MRNDLSIYRTYAPYWWDESEIPCRLSYTTWSQHASSILTT